MAGFYEMDYTKGIVILVKVDEMYNTWNLLATVYWSRDEGRIQWSKFLLESALECPYVYYAPSLLMGRLHFVTDTAAETYKWHWSKLVQRFKKTEIDKNDILTKTYKCYKASNVLWNNELGVFLRVKSSEN